MRSSHSFLVDRSAARASFLQGPICGIALLAVASLQGFVPLEPRPLLMAAWVFVAVTVGFYFQSRSQVRDWRKLAGDLGVIEVDDAGLRWRRKDGSLLRDCPWSDVDGIVIDRDSRNATLILGGGQDHFFVGAATSSGQAFGLFAIERFEELADALIRSGKSVSYGPTLDRLTGRSLAQRGAIACLIAVGLQSATTLWAPDQGGPRLVGVLIEPVLVPSAIGLVGAIWLLVGVLLHFVLGDHAMPIWCYRPRGKLALAALAVLALVHVGFVAT